MKPSSLILDAWKYLSPDEELESSRWYLCARLNAQIKLDAGSLGNAVYCYERLRHAATFLEAVQPDRDLLLSLNPAVGQIFLTEGFPERPFAMLAPEAQANIRCCFEAEWPAAMIEDAEVLQRRGVFNQFISLSAEPGIKAEVPLGPGAAAIVLSVFDDHGIDSVLRDTERLLRERAERFGARRGRELAGERKKENPLYRLKDLASARVFALLECDVRAANKWVRDNQPRDPKNNRRIPWFGQKSSRNKIQPLHRNQRDWEAAINRFSQNLNPTHVR
jgi:hypothetical protein